MSKKRKTRKQKEKAVTRREHQVLHEQTVQPETPASISYSVKDIQIKPKKNVVKIEDKPSNNLSQFKYLKHDIKLIIAATGLILSFDVLLFALLQSNILHLGFLGY